MIGLPVVLVETGGIPVTAVEENAPVMIVAENGIGIAITLTDEGAPFVVQGVPEPDPEP